MLTRENPVIDLNSVSLGNDYFEGGKPNEYRQDPLLPGHGVPSPARIPTMRPPLSRQLQDQELLLPGSIPLHELCADDVSGESQGHRDLPALHAKQALSH